MRRERDHLLGEILQSLERDTRLRSRSVLATHVHVPYDRLAIYLAELAEHGLVTPDEMPRLTARGREFLHDYEAWLAAIERAGLHDPTRGNDSR